MKNEPILIIGAIDAALVAGSAVAPVSSGVHAVIVAVIAGLGFVLGRSQVTPTL